MLCLLILALCTFRMQYNTKNLKTKKNMKTLKEVKIQELNISKSNVVNLNKMRLFTGIDEVELTDELIDQIVKEKKWKYEDLKEFQKDGATWNTQRNSIIINNDFINSLDNDFLEILANIKTKKNKI